LAPADAVPPLRTTKSTTNFQTTPPISGSKIESGELELGPFYGSDRPPLFHKQRVTVWVLQPA
jgi:hypothetical protein